MSRSTTQAAKQLARDIQPYIDSGSWEQRGKLPREKADFEKNFFRWAQAMRAKKGNERREKNKAVWNFYQIH